MPLYGPLPQMARWIDVYAGQIARNKTPREALDYVRGVGSGLTPQQLAEIPLRYLQSQTAVAAINANRPQQASIVLGALRGAAGAPLLIRAVAYVEPAELEPGGPRSPPFKTVIQLTSPAGETLKEMGKAMQDLADALFVDTTDPRLRGGGRVTSIDFIGAYAV